MDTMNFMKGITFAPFHKRGSLSTETARKSFDYMIEKTAADFVVFAPAGIQKTAHSEEICYTSEDTFSDEELICMIRYAKEKGIPVMNVPVYGTDNVSQFAVSLLLEVCSHIGHHSDSVHAGEWASNADWCYWHYPMIEVSGKTAGIIGLGRIGVNTAKILKAMNVNVIAYDAFQSEAGKAVAEYVELDELLAKSDFIFLHCPLFPSTQGIINKENIAKMKDGVIIINNSRGPLIVEQDLYDALESGKVAAAAVDVVSTEPIKADNVLLKAKNCIITPHISWATKEARERIMQTTADNVESVIKGAPQNVVNK